MKKKWTGLVLILIIAISFAGCTDNPFGNRAPTVSVPEELDESTVTAGEELKILLEYSDPDDDEVVVKSVEPSHIEQEWEQDGRYYVWTPRPEDAGEMEITITVTDGELEADTTFTITVESSGSLEPDGVEFADLPDYVDQTYNTGDNLNFRIRVAGEDSDDLDYYATGGLAEYFDVENQIFNWDIGSDQYGEHKITFYVYSDSVSDSKDLTIDVNDSPKIKEIGDKIINEGKNLKFKVEASDRDHTQDELTYEMVEGPENAEFTDQTFSWDTESGDYGEYTLKFRVEDENGAYDEESVEVIVNNIPEFDTAPTNQTFTVGQEGTFSLTVTDKDNDALEVEIYNVYTNNGNKDLDLESYFDYNRDNNTGYFSWAPISGDEGQYSLKFRVKDPHGAKSTASMVITVEAVVD